MAEHSKISWTATFHEDGTVTEGSTWNPVVGCSHVSDGCRNCYAEALSLRRGWTPKPWTAPNAAENVQLKPERLDQPLRWKTPRRVFVNSMSDLFHELVPFHYIDDVFDVMRRARQHTFQVLTKRPERMLEWADSTNARHDDILGGWGNKNPLRNVWLGVSVEAQREADLRIPLLLQMPAIVRFLSCEPLLGPVDLRPGVYLPPSGGGPKVNVFRPWEVQGPSIDWVIVGGESAGPPERQLVTHLGDRLSGEIWTPTTEGLRWVRSLRDQCQSSGTPFFFKQWGGPRPTSGGEVLDGRVWHEFPAIATPEAAALAT